MSQVRTLIAGPFKLVLDRPLIMGIVNITPDSFSDGGRYLDADAAIAHARRLAEEGADILDLGGESTRPGAQPLEADEEMHRILPVLDALRDLDVPLSVDTRKPEVMRAALAHGAAMINDIQALGSTEALDAVRDGDCAVCLMHMQGDPRTMQAAPHYEDVRTQVRGFLAQRVQACEAAGIARERIVIDPGFGFGKNHGHNLDLLRALASFRDLGVPVLAGLSRKSLLGRITGRSAPDRLAGSIALAMLAVQNGADIVRVHDVAATRDALLVQQAVSNPDQHP